MAEKITIPCGNSPITVELNKVAKQSSGSALVRKGDTIVLTTVVGAEEEREDIDFFPLVCDYREQTSAAGKIPGGFFKREGKPTEREILISRLIDRSIRPLFPEDYRREVQVVSFVLSADQENDTDILAIIGASFALSSSPIPLKKSISGVKVAMVDGKFLLNPTKQEIEKSNLNLIISGTENSIVMLEGQGKEISENDFLNAVEFGMENLKECLKYVEEVRGNKINIEKVRFDEEIIKDVSSFIEERIKEVFNYPEKKSRNDFYKLLENQLLEKYDEEKQEEVKKVFEEVLKDRIRKLVVETGKRLDGRGKEEVRPIECEVGLLPRVHGSALFTRGQTQCLASLTLGTSADEQIIDGLYEETTKRFMLHYNFPPFSVGEVSPLRAPSRREIGHGALAEKSLAPFIPDEKDFPYTIRIVANILESNGSSSMATVCAGSLALMDAGVPFKKHIGGVALGMIKEGEKYILLTDIQGEEDHYGDLDLKIAGSKDGITGFQMDVKTDEFTFDILKEAVFQSRKGRIEILNKMYETISSPREEISQYAPKIYNISVDPNKIGLVIGSGGKTIKKIIEDTGAEIDIQEDGNIRIYSSDVNACKKAAEEIKKITKGPEVGEIYEGVVTKILPFGAIVKISPSQEGLVHISEMAPYRIKKVEDILKVGTKVSVKVIGIDEQGRPVLSRKQALKKEGEER